MTSKGEYEIDNLKLLWTTSSLQQPKRGATMHGSQIQTILNHLHSTLSLLVIMSKVYDMQSYFLPRILAGLP